MKNLIEILGGWFIGQEEIFCRGRLVYECRFHGGAVEG